LVNPYFKSGFRRIVRIGTDESLLCEVYLIKPNNRALIPLDRPDLALASDTADQTVAQ
jgi:hypothetical protein